MPFFGSGSGSTEASSSSPHSSSTKLEKGKQTQSTDPQSKKKKSKLEKREDEEREQIKRWNDFEKLLRLSLPSKDKPRDHWTPDEVILDDLVKGAEGRTYGREEILRFASRHGSGSSPFWLYPMLDRILDAGEQQVQLLTRMQGHICCVCPSCGMARCQTAGQDDLRPVEGDASGGSTATKSGGAPPSYYPIREHEQPAGTATVEDSVDSQKALKKEVVSMSEEEFEVLVNLRRNGI